MDLTSSCAPKFSFELSWICQEKRKISTNRIRLRWKNHTFAFTKKWHFFRYRTNFTFYKVSCTNLKEQRWEKVCCKKRKIFYFEKYIVKSIDIYCVLLSRNFCVKIMTAKCGKTRNSLSPKKCFVKSTT